MNLEMELCRTAVQANALIEASYSLNLDEQRLIITAISKIDARNDEATNKLTISAYEYASLWGLSIKNAYKQLETATARLFERKIRITNTREICAKEMPTWWQYRWMHRSKVTRF